MSIDLDAVILRALARRHGITRSEIRELALHIRWLQGELDIVRAQLREARAVVETTLADAEPLKAEVEQLRALAAVVRDGADETATLLVDARLEVRASKAAIDAHQEWRQRAMRVVTAAKEWQRNPRSERALLNLKESLRTYGADA